MPKIKYFKYKSIIIITIDFLLITGSIINSIINFWFIVGLRKTVIWKYYCYVLHYCNIVITFCNIAIAFYKISILQFHEQYCNVVITRATSMQIWALMIIQRFFSWTNHQKLYLVTFFHNLWDAWNEEIFLIINRYHDLKKISVRPKNWFFYS